MANSKKTKPRRDEPAGVVGHTGRRQGLPNESKGNLGNQNQTLTASAKQWLGAGGSSSEKDELLHGWIGERLLQLVLRGVGLCAFRVWFARRNSRSHVPFTFFRIARSTALFVCSQGSLKSAASSTNRTALWSPTPRSANNTAARCASECAVG